MMAQVHLHLLLFLKSLSHSNTLCYYFNYSPFFFLSSLSLFVYLFFFIFFVSFVFAWILWIYYSCVKLFFIFFIFLNFFLTFFFNFFFFIFPTIFTCSCHESVTFFCMCVFFSILFPLCYNDLTKERTGLTTREKKKLKLKKAKKQKQK